MHEKQVWINMFHIGGISGVWLSAETQKEIVKRQELAQGDAVIRMRRATMAGEHVGADG